MTALPERAPVGGGGERRPPVARLLSVAEVADRLSCSQWWIRELIRRGQLFSVKSGRRRLIPETAVDAYIHGLEQ